MLHNDLLALAATAISASAVAPAHYVDKSNVYLRVGPGINASVATPEIHLSCSDDANCQFTVPPQSTFDVVARGGSGQYRWTGCSAQLDTNRCRVEVRGDAVLITVR